MKDLKNFDIPFIGLKEGEHKFEYKVNKEFFDFYDYNEFNNSEVKINLLFLKKATMFELEFKISGWVEVTCDLTNEFFHQPIKTTLNLVVKFGDKLNNENEELLILPHSEHTLNIAQYMYEAIVLAVPYKRIHPGIKDGTLQSDMLEKLKEFEITEENEYIENNQDIDPRWNKLKDILIDKKDE